MLLPVGESHRCSTRSGVSQFHLRCFVARLKTEEDSRSTGSGRGRCTTNPGGETMGGQVKYERCTCAPTAMAEAEISLSRFLWSTAMLRPPSSLDSKNPNEVYNQIEPLSAPAPQSLTMSGQLICPIKAIHLMLATKHLPAHDPAMQGLAQDSRQVHGHRPGALGLHQEFGRSAGPNNLLEPRAELADQSASRKPANCTITTQGPRAGWWIPEAEAGHDARSSTSTADVSHRSKSNGSTIRGNTRNHTKGTDQAATPPP